MERRGGPDHWSQLSSLSQTSQVLNPQNFQSSNVTIVRNFDEEMCSRKQSYHKTLFLFPLFNAPSLLPIFLPPSLPISLPPYLSPSIYNYLPTYLHLLTISLPTYLPTSLHCAQVCRSEVRLERSCLIICCRVSSAIKPD